MTLQALCNSEKDAQLKFSVHNARTGIELNSIKASSNLLLSQKVFQAAENAAFEMKKF